MKLSLDSSRDIKLLQITDTHLFEPEDGCLLSVNTFESFKAVVNAIRSNEIEFDAILATGDISQDHTAVSYQRFEDGIALLKKPCFWLPGNHDFKPEMHSILPSTQIQTTQHVVLNDKWQIILLDSQVEGVPHGRLSEEQLALLDAKLSEYPNHKTVVLLHHHPVLVGSHWLDQHSLKDADAFWSILSKYDKVEAVLCGHVHQDFDVIYQGVRVVATPSTCVQFKPNSDDFALDNLSPGWRMLTLTHYGELELEVGRLPDGEFLPDFSAGGY
ncbi:cyclic 3',5'-adenosine monophosphate phosphodiesterase [Vibrio nigripulchritudo ATCC 27043]|uniref:3',5'-cyclic adenosine monophosphate phosphodiesterase CpdA n=1 Tax=Vibrio nigripulchritudo SOn1 TaxID=1238450 RepID=A0AAV2VQX1_9VIBR|nr:MULTISPECIES: 3',5'-cyclic-AMP phosphodiesterase [Vibrio]EGU61796.1 cyclic 3',5'-adenosine monophosphate phosphodiesterase [Vibrio nigripulchritudo ATCC 27043]KJY71691.1 3',5'-cyclic-nucleotide phosphodiesterase [Vibrio nigripulchritudo]UAB70809.1 3',5'-cyclic-AMP phosphodiesterase [Vibrio sp. SCSIO 43132]CCN35553.1 3',5'-cAMP phosphodiesterase [Vibrio nigripulchritudo AM115]CCN40860.1 3',5'-cAMP phosphodiesterase [Vibrio nigripulchritudo FTn2]